MSFLYSLDTIKTTIKLLKQYENQKDVTPTEFLESQEPDTLSESVAEDFILLLKHKKFFNAVAERICSEYGLKNANEWPLRILPFLLIFVLNEKNFDNIRDIFKAMQHTFAVKAVEFFLSEQNVVFVARAGCMYFDNEYILENVIRPLVLKEKLIKLFHNEVFLYFNKSHSVAPKKTTKPIDNYLCIRKNIQTPVEDVKRDDYKFKPTPIPKSTYAPSLKTLIEINKDKDENWKNALKLYRQAKNCPIRAAHLPPKLEQVEKIPKKTKFAKPPPKFGKVNIKKNTTTLLREAANLAKEKNVECKKLDDLLNGAFDTSKIEAIEEEIRQAKEQQNVQDIERKHLEGLLTFEEAALAKKKLFQANKEKMEKFKEERLALIQELLQWKFEEQEKIKLLVEKSQNIEKAAKESEKKMMEEKHAQAKMVEYESKKLLQEAYNKRENELQEKIKLIQEFRMLHQIRMANFKEFDPTDCPNLGLLCEMPLAELQERLKLLKIQMREELEDKRKAILDEKFKKEEFISNVKEFIEEYRTSKPKAAPVVPPKLVSTPEICALRERLQHAREMRKAIV